MSRTLSFVTCDVFTDRRFAGNQLAVVLDADRLDAPTMQAIAREFNFAETTFVTAPRDPAHAAQVRIFTPTLEMPFAGHPTVGTAFVLAHTGRLADPGATAIVLGMAAGPVPVRLDRGATGLCGATLTAPRSPGRSGAAPGGPALAAALGIDPRQFAGPAEVWSAGAPFVVIPLDGLGALRACRLDDGAAEAAVGVASAIGLYAVAPDPDAVADPRGPDGSWEVRMFAPGAGVREDPATGSAAAAFAGWLAARTPPGAAPGTRRVVLRQGAAIGRPSLLRLEFDLAPAAGSPRIDAVRVGGDVVVFAEGRLSA